MLTCPHYLWHWLSMRDQTLYKHTLHTLRTQSAHTHTTHTYTYTHTHIHTHIHTHTCLHDSLELKCPKASRNRKYVIFAHTHTHSAVFHLERRTNPTP